MELVLVRHALPRRVVTDHGPADPDLSDEGHEQARRLADWLVREPIDAIVTSPLARAIQTAAPLADALGLTPTVVDDLAEWDRESTSYIPIEELQATDDEIWRALAEGRLGDLGIDVVGFADRVTEAFAAVAAANPGRRVVAVCHGGVINCFAATVLGLHRILFFQPDYTSITRVLVSRRGDRSLHTLNETPHLR